MKEKNPVIYDAQGEERKKQSKMEKMMEEAKRKNGGNIDDDGKIGYSDLRFLAAAPFSDSTGNSWDVLLVCGIVFW